MNTFKFKVTMVVTKEFVVLVDCYPDGSSVEDMLKIEQENAEEDPYMVIDEAEIVVSVKVIN